MREILFRGREDSGEWVKGIYIPECSVIVSYFEVCILDTEDDLMNCKGVIREVQEETVGQFTGLTDKNGKWIFEGDRVRVSVSQRFMYGTIEFNKAAFSVKWDDEEYGRNFVGYLNDIEIIGNIHDNPKLLQGVDKPALNPAGESLLQPGLKSDVVKSGFNECENFELREA